MNEKKPRILYLLKYLNEESDEKNPVATSDIINNLSSYGMNVHRNTVAYDISILQEFGVDIVKIKSSPNKYFIGARAFETPELKLLIDAVQSSKFITTKKSEDLIEKIANLNGNNQARYLKRELFSNRRIKPENEMVYYIVDVIYEAINKNKRISFRYFEYTVTKFKSYKHNEYRYEFSPYTLFYNDDHYYAIGYSEKHKDIVNFRIDRMDKPSLLKEDIYPKPNDYDPTEYACKVFDMYRGEKMIVELICEHNLMDVIVDKFGLGVETSIIDNDHFKVKSEVSISPTFFAWVFQFGGRIKIISPDYVIDEMKHMVNKFL